MKLFKKILLGMLTVLMVLSLSMTAFASTADTQSTTAISPVYSTRGTVPSWGNITIKSVAHTSDSFVLRSGKDVTINLNVVSKTDGASMSVGLYNSNIVPPRGCTSGIRSPPRPRCFR